MLDPAWEKLEFEHNVIVPGEALPNLADAPVLAIDLETCPRPGIGKDKKAALNPWKADILGVAVAVPGTAWYLPLRHTAPDSQNLNSDSTLAWLRDTLWARPKRLLVNHNLKFDMKHLDVHGVAVPDETELWCTLVAAVLVNENEITHRLKPLCETELGMPAAEQAILDRYLKDVGTGAWDMRPAPIDMEAHYACGDVERALRLAARQEGQLERQGMTQLHQLERRLIRVLTKMELTGIAVDVDRLKQDETTTLRELLIIESKLEQLTGVSFNPNSSDELADLVGNRLGMPILARTERTERFPHGQPKFDDATLQEYAVRWPTRTSMFNLIRQARQLEHLRTAFIEPYRYWHDAGAIHTNYWQAGTTTGRFSSSDPNLQQVSGDTTWHIALENADVEHWVARGAKRYFTPRPGHAFIDVDLSQIEYRLFAHYTGSSRLIGAYRDNPSMDFHQWCTDEILENRVSRKSAKSLNFGFVYGMGKAKLIASLRSDGQLIDDAMGAAIVELYHKNVPELRPLQQDVGRALIDRGYVRTVLGRRRRLNPGWRKNEEEKKGLFPYQALNAICQGSAADIIKDMMVRLDDALTSTNAQLLLTVHDELIIETPVSEVKSVSIIAQKIMEEFNDDLGKPYLKVPLYAEGKLCAANWQDNVPLFGIKEKGKKDGGGDDGAKKILDERTRVTEAAR